MIHTSRKIRVAVILISTWTIAQTILHIFWVIYGYMLTACLIRPEYYDVVFVYLTYFFKQSCGQIYLRKETLFLNWMAPQDINFTNETTSKVLYHFLSDTLKNAVLPDQSSGVERTEMYLVLLFITDVVWVASAVCLFVGGFCKVKQKYLSIIFYGPWFLCSGFVNFLDVVAAVHYGIDLIYIRSYTDWLNFIGVTNYNDFLPYNEHPSSPVIPTVPTTVVVSLLSRIFVVWLLNVVCFFVIMFLAIPDLFPKTTIRPRSRSRLSDGSKLTLETGEELDLNSSEARIRNWQLFYGAIEANSTMTLSSPGTSAGTSFGNRGNDLSSNKKTRKALEFENKDVHDNPAYETNPLEYKPHATWLGNDLRGISDVPAGVATLPVVDTNNVNLPVLKGYIPWSYINPEGHYIRKQTYTSKPDLKSSETDKDVVVTYMQLPISAEKFRDLQHLKKFCNQAAQDFFSNLPHH